jgi:hypothetical protein
MPKRHDGREISNETRARCKAGLFLTRKSGAPVPAPAGFSRGWEPKGVLRHSLVEGRTEESEMPVILLWGVPTLFVVVGGGYWLMHH